MFDPLAIPLLGPAGALLGTLCLVAAALVGHLLTRQTGREQVTVNRAELGQDIEKIVTARMEYYREETEGLVQSSVNLSTALSTEVARLGAQVVQALAEIDVNRATITAQTSQIATQAVQIIELGGENQRCIDALLERDRREYERDQRDSVRSAHLRAAADA